MEQGLVFDIERFSTADGPGIRTVVFFKGCNMRCYWCHNPEGIHACSELELDTTLCIGCGACFRACPSNAHFMDASEHKLNRELCGRCFACARQCPSGALKVIGANRTLDECMQEIREDLPFYKRSGGGVTLSGGEVLMQADFAAKLLKQCQAEGIHTAIESNLCFPENTVKKVIPWLKLVMTDIKHMDPFAHKSATGQDNNLILRNIEMLDAMGIPMIVRTPVIPGFNDSPENIRSTAEFLKKRNRLCYYELLSYNPMGNEKRKKLGYPVPEISIPNKKTMESLAAIARQSGIPVWVDGRNTAI